ncbi:MAG: LCP family protein, partial [Candidatus Subteraquimicrobiales bacterium]|nr:LCP family protein [Candidatus Subteraquimicrobiales bacterium]
MFNRYKGKHRNASKKDAVIYQNVIKSAPAQRRRKKGKFAVWALLILVFLASSLFAYFKYVEGKMQLRGEELENVKKVTAKRERKEPINILILGSDSRGEKGARSDTIIFLRLNTEQQKAQLVSIPRDSRVSIPEHGVRKINAAYSLGGPSLAIETVQNLLGLPVHHYVEIDFQGFKHLVDAVDGVWVNVEKPIRDHFDGKPQVLKVGYQKLNGTQALIYVRTRKDPTGDFARMERQQNFLKALLKEVCQLKSTLKLPKLVSIMAEYIK